MKTRAAQIAALTSAIFLAAIASARAAPGEEEVVSLDGAGPGRQTAAAAAAGVFLPFTQPSAVENRRAYATGLAGYDSARRSGDFEAAAEVRVWGPLAVRGGAVYTNGDRTLRPSFGARVQFLRQARQGVDGAFGVFYRPEGLTEPEGEIESVVSIGHRVAAGYLVGNLLYGQDPEGNERDGEVRVAFVRPLTSRLFLGADGRLRFDLGSQAAKLAQHHEPTMDAAVGPTMLAVLGPVAVSLEGGASSLRVQGRVAYGAFLMTGVGTTF